MADKNVKSRIQLKRGSEADWIAATKAGFKPLEGEYIFYTDLNNVKVGKKDNNGNLLSLDDLDFLNTDTNQKVKTSNATFGVNDVVEFVAGSNVSIIGDATNKKITISSTYTDTDTHNSHAVISGKKADGNTDIKSTASSGDITLGDSGVTAGEYGPTSNQTPDYGATFNVPDIKVNSKGIVTSVVNRTVKIPASDNSETTLTITDKDKTDTTDLVYAVTNLTEGGTKGHNITPTYTGLPTKAYVDKVITNGVDYLGTVSALTGLSTSAGAGDFYRVSTAFTFGAETAHVGDILIATKANPGQNTTDWDLLHTEVDSVYTHPNSGVTAGTYSKVIVNAQGHVTSGSNPTTLSGHGITDAYTKTETNNLMATLISSGTADPSASTTSQYYFKYN